MADLTTATALWRASIYSGSGSWLDQTVNSHDAALSSSPVHTQAGANSFWTTNGGNFIVPDHADFEVGDGEELTILVRYLIASDPGGTKGMVSKQAGGANAGWSLEMSSSGKVQLDLHDGTNQKTATGGTDLTNGEIQICAGVRDTTDVKVWASGVGFDGSETDTTGDLDSGTQTINIASRAGALQWAARIYDIAWWRDVALTNAELIAVAETLTPPGGTLYDSGLFGIGHVLYT